MGKKLTLIKQKTIYNVRHYDLDDETIIKEFGSIEEFEQYEDLNSFLVGSEYVGHKVINDKGIISEKE